jgi:hypothetical protein
MRPITPRRYDPYEVVINQREASAILEFFFQMKFGVTLITTVDREFAQALLVSAVDSTYLLSFTEKMISVAMKPPASVLSAAVSLTWAVATAGFDFFQYATAKDLKDMKIYKMVRDALASGYKAAAINRLASDTDFDW